MKNLLIATTALVATAGMAAAEITFTGGARFGVIHTGSTTTAATAAVAADGTTEATTAAAEAAAAITGAAFTALTNALTNADTEEAFEEARAALIAANNLATTTAAAVAGSAAIPGEPEKSSTDLHNRFTINIDGTAETNSGLEFFGRVRIRGVNDGDVKDDLKVTTISAPRVGLRAGGFELAVGNILGAIDSLPGLYSGSVGLTGLGYSNVGVGGNDSFSSGGAGSNGAEVIYSANGFGAHLSLSSVDDNDRTALGVSYAVGDWKAALGHQASDKASEDFTVVTVDGSIGSVDVGFAYSDLEDGNFVRVNAGFEVGVGTNVTVFIADTDGASDTAYGVGLTHSLGGATLAGGVVQTATGQTRADLGVRLDF